MARPAKLTVDYFSHDAHASNSRTLFILQKKFGNDGYAYWFKLLELLASSDRHYYTYNNPAALEFLLAKTGVNEYKNSAILSTLVNLDAIDGQLYRIGIIWCQKFVDRLSDVYARRGIKPNKPVIADNNLVNVNNNAINGTNNTQTKVKETKLNNTIVEESRVEEIPAARTIYSFYQNNFNVLTEQISEDLKDMETEYGSEWVIDALKESIRYDKKTLPYVQAILARWKTEGKGKSPQNKEHRSSGPGQLPTTEELKATLIRRGARL